MKHLIAVLVLALSLAACSSDPASPDPVEFNPRQLAGNSYTVVPDSDSLAAMSGLPSGTIVTFAMRGSDTLVASWFSGRTYYYAMRISPTNLSASSNDENFKVDFINLKSTNTADLWKGDIVDDFRIFNITATKVK